MNKVKKISLIIISIIMIIMFQSNIYATSLSDIKEQGDSWLSGGETKTPIGVNEAWDILLPIGKVLVGIASVVLVIAFMYLGITYMMADPSGKANVKQKLIGLVLATIVVYGGMGIFTIIINLLNSIFA